jgi:dynein heavy chain
MDNITFIIYENVCRGLFNNHKRIFSFLVSTSIEIKAKIISAFEWKAFIKGIIQMGQLPELP